MGEPAKSGVEGGAPNGGAANNGAWADSLDAEMKPWVSGMGLDKLEPAAALAKVLPMYRGAEQKLGIPADQLLRLPGKDAKPEDWMQVWGRLGRPEKPDGYEIKAPDGDAGEFLRTATGWFHEIGVPKGMARALAGKWNEYVGAQQEADVGRWNQRFDKEHGDLKGEWKGEDYNKNIDLSKRVMKAMGLSQQDLQAVERALGPKQFHMAFARFGGMVGEHRFVGGEGDKQFAMSSEGAKTRLAELQKDAAFTAKLTAGDVDAKAEWTRLHQVAFPEPVAA